MEILKECRPVYEVYPGWQSTTQGIREFSGLPPRARDYIRRLEDAAGTKIAIVSTSPDRDDTIIRKDGFLAYLTD